MYRANTGKCLIAIRKFLDDPSDKIERPNLAVRLGNFRIVIRQFSVFALYIIIYYRPSVVAVFFFAPLVEVMDRVRQLTEEVRIAQERKGNHL